MTDPALPEPGPEPETTTPVRPMPPLRATTVLQIGLVLAVVAGLLTAVLLWQKVSLVQAQFASQQQEISGIGQEARALARNAAELSQQTAAKAAVLEARLNEMAVQKSQVDEVLQSLSQSKVENLVVEIEASLLLAQQQAQLTGSVDPLLTALSGALTRIAKMPSPRLTGLENTLRRDIDRLRSSSLLDTPAVSRQIDELVRLIDEIPLVNSTPTATKPEPKSVGKSDAKKPDSSQTGNSAAWLDTLLDLKAQFLDLVRLQKIDNPEAVLLTPDQAFFVKENLKLKLLNARIGLLTRQFDLAKADLLDGRRTLEAYFDVRSKKGAMALMAFDQTMGALKNNSQPNIDASLNAVAVLTRRR